MFGCKKDKITCCYTCDHHSIYCHETCEKYIQEKANYLAKKHNISKMKADQNTYTFRDGRGRSYI